MIVQIYPTNLDSAHLSSHNIENLAASPDRRRRKPLLPKLISSRLRLRHDRFNVIPTGTPRYWRTGTHAMHV
jgi:hypothetical protein